MKYPGPIRPEPPSRPSRRWWPILLTILCAGGWQLLYWLCASGIVRADIITLAIVVAVPVAAFVLAGDGARVLFRGLISRHDVVPPLERSVFSPTGQMTDLPVAGAKQPKAKPILTHPRDDRPVTKPPRDRR